MPDRWRPTEADVPCAQKSCVGIKAGEWCWQLEGGRFVHTVGMCHGPEGKTIPVVDIVQGLSGARSSLHGNRHE